MEARRSDGSPSSPQPVEAYSPPGRVDGPKEKRIRLRFSSSVTKNDALALLFLAGICAAARGVCGNKDRKERGEEEEGFGFRALVDRGVR